MLLHAEATAIPPQVIVNSPKAAGNNLSLLFGTSTYDLKTKQMPQRDDLVEKNGLRFYAADAALVKVAEAFFQRSPIEGQVVLKSVRDMSGVLGRLLDGGHSAVPGRLAGAFQRVGKNAFADDIVKTMKGAMYDVRETDPFDQNQHVSTAAMGGSPIVARLNAIWESQRQAVLDVFPVAHGLPSDTAAFMKSVEDIYKNDAYHSLSIEGYSVTPELIDRVRAGSWDPDVDQQDKQNHDALAARGYWQAFQSVKESVPEVLSVAPAGAVVRKQQRDWYRELFSPSVAAGILKPSALAGYLNHPVYLRGSWHEPPRSEAVPDGMEALFDLLEKESEPAVRAQCLATG